MTSLKKPSPLDFKTQYFSKAKGGKPDSKKIRSLAWVVIR